MAWALSVHSWFNSPRIEKIEVVRHARVRRKQLYYLRGLTGKAARLKELRPIPLKKQQPKKPPKRQKLAVLQLHRIPPPPTTVETKTHKAAIPPALPTLEEEMALLSQGYSFIAGLDEAGRGCLAGPVVACRCHLPLNDETLASL